MNETIEMTVDETTQLPPTGEFPVDQPAPEQQPPEQPAQEPPLYSEQALEEFKKGSQVQLVDGSDAVQDHAADYADERLREETTRKGFKGFLGRIWKGNIARDYYRQKYVREGREKQFQEQNIYTLQGGSKEQHNQALEAVVERFTSEYATAIHSGESNVDASEKEGGNELETELKRIISSFAKGDIDHDALEQEKNRLLQGFYVQHRQADRNKGLIYASNITEVAKNARAAFEHGVALEAIDAAMSIKVGEARMGVRTAASKEMIDRAMDKIYSHGLPAATLNETVLSTAAAVALSASKFGVRKLTSALIGTGTFGLSSGLIAGARESHHVKQERRLHMRQMAEGGELKEQVGKRRAQMEETRYETVSANDLIEQLTSAGQSFDEEGSPESLASLLERVTEAQTRIKMSDSMNIDLISFDSKFTVEQQRLDLDIALARAKVALAHSMEQSSPDTLQQAGVAEAADVDNLIHGRSETLQSTLQEDLTARDKAFRHLQAKRVLQAAAIGVGFGAVIGTGVQELKAAIEPSLQGVFEKAGNGTDRRTELAAIFHDNRVDDHQVGNTHPGTADFNNSAFKLGNDALDLPTGYHMVHDTATNAFSMVGPDGKVVASHVNFDPSGHLDAATSQLLQKEGFQTNVTSEVFQTAHTATHTITTNPNGYIAANPHEFTSINRELWYDNNTPNVFDQNELKLDWGGPNGSGINADGNYVMNVSHMMPNGSFHDGLSANYQQLIADHKMAIAISLDQASQNHVVLIPIDTNGDAVFNLHDPVMQSVFENHNGQAHFVGGYAEAVQLTNNTNGVQGVRMLATVVGSNEPHPLTYAQTLVTHSTGEHVVTHIEAPVEKNIPIEITPVIPIRARRGLESFPPEVAITNPEISGMYYGGRSLQELKDWLAADPSLLKTRREVVDENGEKHWQEADGSPVERSLDRERTVINEYLEKEKQKNPAHYEMVTKVAETMRPMEGECRVSINVPAWMEEGNLEHFLAEYTEQIDKEGTRLKPELYEINILVNRKTSSEPDNSIGVIEKFIADFEQRNGFRPPVNFYDVELDPPFNNVGYARKLLTDAVMMRSLNRPHQEAPLYIETEDADLINIDNRTVINIVDKLDANPQLDAVRGIQDRTPEYLKLNDYLFLRRRASDFFEILARKRKFRDPAHPNWNFTWNRIVTGGWNTAYTAEAYALIGGYDIVVAGEDMSVGEKMTMIRGDGNLPNLEVVGQVYTRTDSSPRRFINEIITEQPAYEDFGNEEINRDIRETSIEDALKAIRKYERINPENESIFSNYLTFMHKYWATSTTPNAQEAAQLTRRLLFFLGFKKDDYELNEGDLIIKSWDNVKAALDNYRLRHA